ncbi:hypothetical protein V8F20_012036 [Naviculisporaceae sp. PSN 640]
MSSYEVDMSGVDDFDRLLLAQPDVDIDTELERIRSRVYDFDEIIQSYGNTSADMDMNHTKGPNIATTVTEVPQTSRQSRVPPVPPSLTIEPPLLDLSPTVHAIKQEHGPRVHAISPYAKAVQDPEILEMRDNIAFAFGIEHVLMYKGHLLPGAVAALKTLIRNNIPFGLFTNDDGFRDGDQMDRIVALLSGAGITINRQIIVDYNIPFRTISRDPRCAGKDILIISGCGEIRVRTLAQRAGLRPDRIWTPATLPPDLDIPIGGIMIWSQPQDWNRDLGVVCRVISKYRRDLRIFVCNEDFNRATDYQYPSTDYWTFYHLLISRPEWSENDKDWLSEMLLAPWANNFKNNVFVTFQEMVARQYGANDIDKLDFKKMYFVTENYQRDIRQLVRHEDSTVQPGTKWEVIPIANIGQEPHWWVSPDAHLNYIVDEQGARKCKYVIDYQPEVQFAEVLSAVRSLLARHSLSLTSHQQG